MLARDLLDGVDDPGVVELTAAALLERDYPGFTHAPRQSDITRAARGVTSATT
jgi:hypothetical protein